jgi:hypothetical protein
VKVLKSHEFWIGFILALVLVGFIPQLNFVSSLKGKKGM